MRQSILIPVAALFALRLWLAPPPGRALRINPWRRALEARLIEGPVKGRANCQLTGEVARVLGVSESEVEVLSGHKSARKVLLVEGIAAEQAVSVLGTRLR